ncbi:hypothetical protein [Paraclostridium bifermentans]|uniref:hypothetical protein n=1 Tax=Paraclostridium bifermentans TaxID=1490 RepID=UPI0014768F5D|nr:hypothetical protein [Paraclostridium bifermentans]
MEELRFDNLQEINGGSNLTYDMGKWYGNSIKTLKKAQKGHIKRPIKTSYGTIWV